MEKVVLNSGASTPIGKAFPCRASSPMYSPDGTRIAFACESKPTERSRILIMDADGSNLHPLFSSTSKTTISPHTLLPMEWKSTLVDYLLLLRTPEVEQHLHGGGTFIQPPSTVKMNAH